MSVNSTSPQRPQVCIIGGGLAGIACASALADFDFDVSLHEGKNHLGGRAGSYQDQSSNELIDNCQHVSMGCCTNLKKLSHKLGIEDCFETQSELYFVGPDNTISTFSESWLPAPFHLSFAFLRLPYITFQEKRLFAFAVKKLAQANRSDLAGLSFADWLKAHRQTPSLIKRVWEVVLVSALSESLDRIDAAYAQKVFFDGFLANREGWRVEIPNTSLKDLYSEQAAKALKKQGVNVFLNSRLGSINCFEKDSPSATISNGETVLADEFVLAIPHYQISKVLPIEYHAHAILQDIERIETAPISSVHLWLDRKMTDLPHAVFVDKFSQWLFSRGITTNEQGEDIYRYQIVISASRDLGKMDNAEIIETIMSELAQVWSEAELAKLIHSRIITEKRAVFSVVPGIDEYRPAQQSMIPNVHFAGDWTQTYWPSTMEGAVRSGYLAAESILSACGKYQQILAPNLPQAALSRWIFGAANTEIGTVPE